MKTHEGRVAVVSGAARSIGQAVAAGLASRGASIVGVDLAPADETRGLVAALGAEWLEIVADVSSPDDVRRVADRTLARFGRCDILVNDAGITVNAASPSLTRTPGILSSDGAAKMLDIMAQKQAIKRVSEPEDVVGLLAFLTGNDSHFVTGQTMLADGGLS